MRIWLSSSELRATLKPKLRPNLPRFRALNAYPNVTAKMRSLTNNRIRNELEAVWRPRSSIAKCVDRESIQRGSLVLLRWTNALHSKGNGVEGTSSA